MEENAKIYLDDVKYKDRFRARRIGAIWDPLLKKWYTMDPVISEAWKNRQTEIDNFSKSDYSRGPSGKGLNEKYVTRTQILNRMETLVKRRDAIKGKIMKLNAKIGSNIMEFRRLEEL